MGSWTLPKVEGLAPAPRGGMACTSLGSKLLVFGGADRTPIAYDDLWSLDLGREGAEWTRISCSLPADVACKARAGATLAAVGDEVYLFGGQDPMTGIAFNDLLVLDTTKWQWSRAEAANRAPPGRHSHCAGCLQGNCLLVFGGAGMQGTLGDAWVYNPATKAWAKLEASGTAPQAREMHTGVMVTPNRLLVFGGRGADGRVLGDVSVLDVKAAAWVQRRDTAYERCAHSAVALGCDAGVVADETSVIGDAAPSPCNASAAECSSAAPPAASTGMSPAATAGASTADVESQPPCEGLSAAAVSQQQQRHHQQHCRQQVLVYGGFSGTQVEGSLLSIDVQSLEVTAVGKASKGASDDASGKLPGQSKSSTSCQPAERFAHCAAAVTLPQRTASTGRAKECMVVFGGVNPSEDLNDFAVWQDQTHADSVQHAQDAAELIKALHVAS